MEKEIETEARMQVLLDKFSESRGAMIFLLLYCFVFREIMVLASGTIRVLRYPYFK